MLEHRTALSDGCRMMRDLAFASIVALTFISTACNAFPSWRERGGSAFSADQKQAVNVFDPLGRDPREAVDLSEDKALRPIGRLGGTTAFLVSPCYILTAYHSVFGFSNASKVSLVTQLLFSGAENTLTSYEAVPVLWGEGHLQSAIREDWALLHVAGCPGKSIGWLELSARESETSLTGKQITIAGHPNDKPKEQLWRDRSGYIGRIGTGLFRDCLLNFAATRAGNSGSPVYDDAAVPIVVGLQVRELNSSGPIVTSYDERHANVAIDIGYIQQSIQVLLDADKAAFWAERPDLARVNPAHL